MIYTHLIRPQSNKVQAEGAQSAECEGAQFQNDDNVITIETWPTVSSHIRVC